MIQVDQIKALLANLQQKDPTTYNAWRILLELLEQTIPEISYRGGSVGIGTTNPSTTAKLDVNGAILGIPIAAAFESTATTIGFGSYVWDKELFSSAADHFGRSVGNTRIVIKVPGKYQFIAQVLNSGMAAEGDATIDKNGAITITDRNVQTPTGFIRYSLAGIIDCKLNDYFTVNTYAGNRYGDAINHWSTFYITRLN